VFANPESFFILESIFFVINLKQAPKND